ncbi:putative glucan 1,3-beta-glucosidase [Planoprotostelium fungivorum]|uniref:glucan 1,3-beta-glucosidase n=1 Tax=Planoprotostelium fungivorum TaxID=1890364 RepID=A0A2P6MQR6_9EUKA|nr:putative glucan 1,3-beta-glucosidase [Planoprotostelium fungivorum]
MVSADKENKARQTTLDSSMSIRFSFQKRSLVDQTRREGGFSSEIIRTPIQLRQAEPNDESCSSYRAQARAVAHLPLKIFLSATLWYNCSSTMARSLPLLLVAVVAFSSVFAQNCNCPSDQCCSQFGYCGTGNDFCGAGCQQNCGNNGNNGNTQWGPIDQNVDRGGLDLPNQPGTASSAGDCQTQCYNNNNCQSWAFDSCGKNCWLKGGLPNPVAAGCRASGTINGRGNNNGGGNSCAQQKLASLMNGNTKPKGANLGSWFVLEAWMSGGPWDAGNCDHNANPGSYLLEQCLNRQGKRQSVMNNHWNTFITENDFQQMSAAGINFVRLPVGWWHIYDDYGGPQNVQPNVTPNDYQTGGLAYITKAFDWAAKYGIGVLLCMHAAPGSQGGTDNSSPPDASGNFYWDKYPNNQAATVDSVTKFVQKYNGHPAYWGVALLNEPRGDTNVLRNYYLAAYAKIRTMTNKPVVINPLISPFQSGTELEWITFMPGFTNVWYDLHYYSCFGGDGDQTSSGGAIGYINWDRKNQIAAFKAAQPGKKILVGEWSGANHFGDDNVVGFVNAQMNVYGTADGWTFWSWAGSGGGWNFRDMLGKGIDKGQLNQQC